ncbi:MAG TPA: hypothetical protein VF691_17930 [Cytophagaceae bacterium]|jgi:hypothetical protein
MSFLKQLLTPFIEFDPEQKPEKKPVDNKIQDVNVPTKVEDVHHPLIDEKAVKGPPQPNTPSPAAPIDTSMPLREHVQYFEKLIEKANNENPLFVGADYKEFVDAKVDIDDIVDENIKYKTAFNILKSSGLTKDKLLATGREYLNIIGRDLNVFQTAHGQQYKKELHQKEIDLQKKVEELQVLTQKITLLKSQINQLSTDLSQSQTKLDHTKRSFLLAGEMKQHEIQTELNKIAKYFD